VRRELDGADDRCLVRPRLRDRLPRHARDLVGGQLAAGGEAPRAVDEHAHAEAGGLVVDEPLNAVLAREDVLRAVATDPTVRVLRAGGLGRIERAHGELLEARIVDREVVGVGGSAEERGGGPRRDAGNGEGGRGRGEKVASCWRHYVPRDGYTGLVITREYRNGKNLTQ
jgi:hypothetical protein